MATKRGGLGPWIPLILRLLLGGLFIAHGAQKLGILDGPGVAGMASYFKSLGIAPPLLWAWVVALTEFFGGIAILLGLLTRAASALIIIDMGVAIAKVHWAFGFDVAKGGYELALSLGVIALVLLIQGAGPVALDRLLGIEKA